MKPKATVILPTFGDAAFCAYCLRTIQNQTVAELEIAILCDGSPGYMIEMLEGFQKNDPRIKIYNYPKSEYRASERRDTVIKNAKAPSIFYCCHGDLWLKFHVEALLEKLKTAPLVHSVQTEINLPGLRKNGNNMIYNLLDQSLSDPEERSKLIHGLNGQPYNFFGITVAAHTKEAYLSLPEGWIANPGIWTDLYLWRQFITKYGGQCISMPIVTTLKFPTHQRKGQMSAEERKEELEEFFHQIDSPLFQAQLCAWIRKYIDARNEACKQENEKLIFQNDLLKQEVRIHQRNSESKDRDIAALQEAIERIYNSGSWKFGHRIVSSFRKFFPK